MIWFVLVATRQILYLRKGSNVVTFNRYNFDIYGNLTMLATSTEEQILGVALYNLSSIRELEKAEKNDISVCAGENLTCYAHFPLEIVNGVGRLELTINSSEVLSVAVSSCSGEDHADVEITAYYRNPVSYLSADMYPSLYLKAVLAGIYILIAGVWVFQGIQHKIEVKLIWHMLTMTQFFLILDNLIFFGLLYYNSSHDDPNLALMWIRYFTRCISITMFYCTVVVAAIKTSLPEDVSFQWQHIVAGVVTGSFLGIPITCIEEFNKSESQLWYNFVSAIWLFICWSLSFSQMFKQMIPLAAKVEELKKMGVDHRHTSIGEQWRALTLHLNLYAIMMFTGLLWVLIPYPEDNYFWVSQVVLDVPYVLEMVLSVALFLKQKPSYGVKSNDLQLSLTDHADRDDENLSEEAFPREELGITL